MLAKRIIPCLDIKYGKVVKGVRFKNPKIEDDPAALAALYEEEGADEIVFLNVTASHKRRDLLLDVVRRTADMISIPFIVGGGIRDLEEISKVLNAGADKVSINTVAIRNPMLIRQATKVFGSQCVVVAIDAKRRTAKGFRNTPLVWEVYIEGGRLPTGLDAISWARTAEKLGAGEILLTSMDHDGPQLGYDIPLIKVVSQTINIPVIANCSVGTPEHLYKVLTEGMADAALATSIFYRFKYSIKRIKEYLIKKGVSIRPV